MRDRDAQDWTAAIASCELELERTNDLHRAIDAAIAAYHLQRPQDELRFAMRALAESTFAADAHFYAGHAQRMRGDYGAAASHLALAATQYARAGNSPAVSRAEQLRASVWYQLGEFDEALNAAEAARAAARRANDERMVTFVDLARAKILREIGDLRAAELVVELAVGEAHAPADQVLAWLERAILHIDQGHPALARVPLTQALQVEAAARSPRPETLQALHLNLSFVERRAHAFTRALEEMEHAKRAGADAMSYHLNRGLVYAEMDRLTEAAADLAAAEAEPADAGWAWQVPWQRAKIAARSMAIADAITADRRAIERVARLAAKSGAFGPTVIANHREPHLHLIGLLAHDERWRDVLEVVATMDGQALLDSREPATEVSPTSAAHPPAAPQPALRSPAPDAATLAQAWRGRRLVILVPGGDRVWRIDVCNGEVTGRNVGDANELADLARRLETDPDDLEAGRLLGAAFLPVLALRERVALLVVGPLARAPLAALQIGDRAATTLYQLMRAPGLLPRAASPRPHRPAIVVGDPHGDLPAAASEARKVASQLGGTALVGGAATRAAFAMAAGVDVLHVAAHTTQRRDGATLDLADGPITVADVAKLGPAPRLVVLASCGGAAGRDDAGNGSLTTAFLDAGADAVVGTRWSVGDADAARFVEAFYANGGDRDPVRALGETQRASKLPATTWAAFEAFVARPTR